MNDHRGVSERTAQTVPGGPGNVQDIYPLSPLQSGMLFHRLLNQEQDTYILSTLFELQSGVRVEAFIAALQRVVDRHDVLRSAIVWEGLPHPAQVVCKSAELPVAELPLPPDGAHVEYLRQQMRPELHRLDLCSAPLLRLCVTNPVADGTRYALLLVHHMICDHQSLQALIAEALAVMQGDERELPTPVPYRRYVEHALANARTAEAQVFFRSKLGDVDEPTAAFSVADVHGDGSRTEEASRVIAPELAARVRAQARRSGTSVARLFHAAWALVVAHTSGRDDVVYGTVVLTARQRKNARAERMLGMSVNTLPLRLQLREMSAVQLVERTHRELTELLEYEQTPLTLAHRASAVPAGMPLFTTLFNYRRTVAPADSAARTGVRVLARGEAWSNYPIALIVDDLGTDFAFSAQVDRRIDAQRVIGYLEGALHALIDALERAADTPVLRLSILPADERCRLIEGFNATQAPYPHDRLLHELFEEQVGRRPESIAAIWEERSITYADLNAKANQLARHLCRHGVTAGDFVAVLMPRSLHGLIAQLAILKCGAVYVPLDPELPIERRDFMISDCGARAVLTMGPASTDDNPARLWIDCLQAASGLTSYQADNLQLRLDAAPPAYVMYTSGSTGTPKGVVVPHRAVIRLVVNNGYARIEPDDCLGHYSNPTFDASTLEVWGALLNGARMLIVPQAIVLEAARFAELLLRHGVTLLYMSVGLFSQYTEVLADVFAGLRYLMVGGDTLEPGTIRRVLQHRPPQHLLNVYGPTECTTYSTTYAVESVAEGANSVPIGRPIANGRIYILNAHGAPVPIGVTGEIYIGGAGVACGYLNRPDLTAERFVADPFSAEPAARMYRTGDLGRWRADGVVEHQGRNDFQVKIRGFRIELGEIEARLLTYPDVKEAIVLARSDGHDKRLVAYLVPQGTAPAPRSEDLRVHLRAALPEYMLPSAFVVLERMPLTTNGKIDRRTLPTPNIEAYATRGYEGPQSEVEEILAGIWTTLLGVERVGRNDNFFELGGHSLLIVQMMEQLRRIGLSIEVRRIFEAPTLKDLARELDPQSEGQLAIPPNAIAVNCTEITPEMLPLVQLEQQHIERIARAVPGGAANIQDIYPPAPLQLGILFHHLMHEQAGDPYVVPLLLSIASDQRLSELVSALQAVIDRHDALRTAFLWEGLPQPVQVVHRNAVLPVEQVSLDAGRPVAEQLEQWLRSEDQHMDVSRAPLMRLRAAKDPHDDQWYVLLQLHHLTADNTSQDIVVSETEAFLTGRATDLPAPVGYRNHVAQALAHAQAHDAEQFFRTKLADVDEQTAPFGLLDVHGDGGQIDEARIEIAGDLARTARGHARRLGVSAATLFHAAYALVVAQTSGRDDVVFGSVLLGRLHGSAGAQRILGLFINTLPLRLRLHGVTAQELVEQTQRELIELLSHEQSSLAVAQRCSGIPGSRSPFTALLNYRHAAPDAQWLHADGIRTIGARHRTNYPITVSVDDLGERFALTVQSDRRVDPQRIACYLRTALAALVHALADAPDTAAMSLPILPDAERQQLLAAFNAGSANYSEPGTVHGLFEAQVCRTPQALAVAYGERSLTYQELNERANQLARHLIDNGVGADRLVGICVERSIEMIVGIVATLKAGGAYVPLDPTYPAERLAYMIEDAAPRVVLTQAHLAPSLPGNAGAIFAMDRDWHRVASFDRSNVILRDPSTGEQLAYVIYTSGSTGRPKGVMIEHRNVLNLWRGLLPFYDNPFSCRLVALNASISFDASVQQFVQLLSGRTLVLVPQSVRQDPALLVRFLDEQRIDACDCTPAQLRGWIASGLLSGPRHAPRLFLVGGEAIDLELWRALAQSGRDFVNVYGPTECTVDATAAKIQLDSSDPHIGRPMHKRRVYILGRNGQPVPLGVAGEIHIGGAGIGRGYLHQPELTAQRFVQDPFVTERGARMYKTGDIGRWRAEGVIEYLGRNDDQVKLRGYRIELGEIEAQLARYPALREVAVIVRENTPGEKRLVAYATLHERAPAPGADQLRSFLQAQVPEYMMPSAFVILERLPVTPSGKLDRHGLPVPEQNAFATRLYEPPRGATEELLAEIWGELLGVARVGREDDFFTLGGHSLLAMQLTARIQAALATEVSIRAVFEFPRLLQMAAQIDSRRGARVVDAIMEGDTEMRDLLDAVASMPDSAVRELLGDLTTGGRS